MTIHFGSQEVLRQVMSTGQYAPVTYLSAPRRWAFGQGRPLFDGKSLNGWTWSTAVKPNTPSWTSLVRTPSSRSIITKELAVLGDYCNYYIVVQRLHCGSS